MLKSSRRHDAAYGTSGLHVSSVSRPIRSPRPPASSAARTSACVLSRRGVTRSAPAGVPCGRSSRRQPYGVRHALLPRQQRVLVLHVEHAVEVLVQQRRHDRRPGQLAGAQRAEPDRRPGAVPGPARAGRRRRRVPALQVLRVRRAQAGRPSRVPRPPDRARWRRGWPGPRTAGPWRTTRPPPRRAAAGRSPGRRRPAWDAARPAASRRARRPATAPAAPARHHAAMLSAQLTELCHHESQRATSGTPNISRTCGAPRSAASRTVSRAYRSAWSRLAAAGPASTGIGVRAVRAEQQLGVPAVAHAVHRDVRHGGPQLRPGSPRRAPSGPGRPGPRCCRWAGPRRPRSTRAAYSSAAAQARAAPGRQAQPDGHLPVAAGPRNGGRAGARRRSRSSATWRPGAGGPPSAHASQRRVHRLPPARPPRRPRRRTARRGAAGRARPAAAGSRAARRRPAATDHSPVSPARSRAARTPRTSSPTAADTSVGRDVVAVQPGVADRRRQGGHRGLGERLGGQVTCQLRRANGPPPAGQSAPIAVAGPRPSPARTAARSPARPRAKALPSSLPRYSQPPTRCRRRPVAGDEARTGAAHHHDAAAGRAAARPAMARSRWRRAAARVRPRRSASSRRRARLVAGSARSTAAVAIHPAAPPVRRGRGDVAEHRAQGTRRPPRRRRRPG